MVERERDREVGDKRNKSGEIIRERWGRGWQVESKRDGGWERNISFKIGEKVEN